MRFSFVDIFLCILLSINYIRSQKTYFIGGILPNEGLLNEFHDSVNNQNNVHRQSSFHLKPLTLLLDQPNDDAVNAICQLVEQSNSSLIAIITAEQNEKGSRTFTSSLVCSLNRIPLISLDYRKNIQEESSIHTRLLRMQPSFIQEYEIWQEILVKFHWKEVNIIAGDSYDHKLAVYKLSDPKFNSWKYKIKNKILVNRMDNYDDLRSKLQVLSTESVRPILLLVSPEQASEIFEIAQGLNLLSKGNLWLVTEEIMSLSSGLTQGILGLRLKNPEGRSDSLRDAIDVVSSSLRVYHSQISQPLHSVRSCNEKDQSRQFDKFFKTLKSSIIKDGFTGRVEFNNNGERTSSIYELVNTQIEAYSKIFSKKVIGTFDPKRKSQLEVKVEEIFWPGNFQHSIRVSKCLDESAGEFCPENLRVERSKVVFPPYVEKKKHLKVVTLESSPFVFKRLRTMGQSCNRSDDMTQLNSEVDCSHTDPITGTTINYCCYGYCIDLLRRVSMNLDGGHLRDEFTFDLHLVGDWQIGKRRSQPSYNKQDEYVEVSDTNEWTGAIGELLDGKADLSVAPIAVNPERVQYISFTKPFKYAGYKILTKKRASKTNLDSFLQPFDLYLWLVMTLTVMTASLVLYSLERISPFSKDPKRFTMTSSLCLITGILVSRSFNLPLPKSPSARLFTLLWACLAFVAVAAYIANLSAFFVVDRSEGSFRDPITSIGQGVDITLATVKNSHVDSHLQSSVKYSKIYHSSIEKNNFDTLEEAILAVKNGSLSGLIWDSARLDYETTLDCSLTTTQGFLIKTDFVIATRLEDPWLKYISQRVLKLSENGILNQLDLFWMGTKRCSEDFGLTSLRLSNMATLFIVVIVGISIGILFFLAELIRDKRKAKNNNNLTEENKGQLERIKNADFSCKHQEYAEDSNSDPYHTKKKRISLVPKVTLRNVE